MQRLIAILLAVFFLGLAGLMASVTLFVRDPLPVVSARVPLVAAAAERGTQALRATLVVDGAFRFEVTGEGSRGVPAITLRRGDAGVADIPVEVDAPAAGVFRGRGQFTAPGRWVLAIEDGGGLTEFPFILQE